MVRSTFVAPRFGDLLLGYRHYTHLVLGWGLSGGMFSQLRRDEQAQILFYSILFASAPPVLRTRHFLVALWLR